MSLLLPIDDTKKMFRRFRRRRSTSIVILTADGKGAVPPPWSFPEGLELQHDTSPARWIEEALTKPPWETVGSLVPEGYEAYARILHPAERNGEPMTWTEVASLNDRVMHPMVQFARIADLGDDPNEHPPGMQRPREGSHGQGIFKAMARSLDSSTTTPDLVWFCLWHGDGALSILEGYDKRTHPLVEIPSRKYLLLRGSMEAVGLFDDLEYVDGPNIWWPEDRAWCVASEIDLDSTYVGGSAVCIGQLLNNEVLEVLKASVDDRVDIGADTINPRTTSATKEDP